MAAKKFAISVPEDVMKQVDRAAKDRKITRSRFIADILRQTASARSDAEVTRQLNLVFSDGEADRAQREDARSWQRAASANGTEW